MSKIFSSVMTLGLSVLLLSACDKSYKCDCVYDSERVITTLDKSRPDAERDCDIIREELYEQSNNVSCKLR